MATALFPKKKTFVTYGRRSAGKTAAGSSGASGTSRPPQAAIDSLSAESSKEDLEVQVANDDAKSSDDDELPSIASISNASRPAGSQTRRARVPEVVVNSGSARKPSAKALGKRRMQEPVLDIDEASIALDVSGSPHTATAKATRRTSNAMKHAANRPASSSPDSRSRGPLKRRRMASPTASSTAPANKGRGGRPDIGNAEDSLAIDRETSERASIPTSRTPDDLHTQDKLPRDGKDASEDIPSDLPRSASAATRPTLSISAPSSPNKAPVPPDLHSPARTERASDYSMSPPPSPPDLPIPLEDEALGFGFDDLLGGPSTSLALPTARPVSKRKPLIRHMSARSDIDSDAGSCRSSFPVDLRKEAS